MGYRLQVASDAEAFRYQGCGLEPDIVTTTVGFGETAASALQHLKT